MLQELAKNIYIPVEKKPSPANYRPNLNHLNRAPAYSCGKNCRPVYPDVLGYPEVSKYIIIVCIITIYHIQTP